MNKTMVILAGAAAFTVGLTGCAPQLDEWELSPEEQQWEAYISESYTAWERPQTVPRGVYRADVPKAAKETTISGSDDAFAELHVDTAPAADLTADAEMPVEEAVVTEEVAIAEPAPEAQPAAQVEYYTVGKGDTLGAIARKYYGKASAWKKIQDANADVLKGSSVIRPGMKLLIPKP